MSQKNKNRFINLVLKTIQLKAESNSAAIGFSDYIFLYINFLLFIHFSDL